MGREEEEEAEEEAQATQTGGDYHQWRNVNHLCSRANQSVEHVCFFSRDITGFD